MRNLAIVIVDLDKMSKSYWKELWTEYCDYAMKIDESQRQQLIELLETIIENKIL